MLDAKYGTCDTYYPKTDWREQAPSDWISRIVKSTGELKDALSKIELCGIGVSGHSLGALPVDKDGLLLVDRIPIWSDARARKQADEFFGKTDYRASEIAVKSGALFVKTGTGWGNKPTTVDHIRLIHKTIGDSAKIKAAGGVRNLDTILEMVDAGCSRFGIGVNSSISILREAGLWLED